MGYRNIYIYLDDEREPFGRLSPMEQASLFVEAIKQRLPPLRQLVIKAGLILLLI